MIVVLRAAIRRQMSHDLDRGRELAVAQAMGLAVAVLGRAGLTDDVALGTSYGPS
jgi:hypothetical protein